MKRHFIVAGAFTACLAVVASASASGAAFDAPAGDPQADVASRCIEEDPIRTNAEAVERVNWAIGCNLISQKWEYKFYYDVDANGNRVKKALFQYPTFAHDDHAVTDPPQWPVWTPARDANGKFTDCSVPPDVKFYSICKLAPWIEE